MIERDNLTPEPTDKAEKIKTPFAVVIVGGPIEKPCYSIMWWDTIDREYNIGYSSYNLGFVFEWLRECFEVDCSMKHPHEIALDDLIQKGRWRGWHGERMVAEDEYRSFRYYSCSECDRRTAVKSRYCPNCGAKMDLKE